MMTNKAMKLRHWNRISETTGHPFEVESDSFCLRNIMEAPLLKHKDDIEVKKHVPFWYIVFHCTAFWVGHWIGHLGKQSALLLAQVVECWFWQFPPPLFFFAVRMCAHTQSTKKIPGPDPHEPILGRSGAPQQERGGTKDSCCGWIFADGA